MSSSYHHDTEDDLKGQATHMEQRTNIEAAVTDKVVRTARPGNPYEVEADLARLARPAEAMTVLENGEEEVLIWLKRGELMSALEVQAREVGMPVSKVLTIVVGYGLTVLGYDMSSVLDSLGV